VIDGRRHQEHRPDHRQEQAGEERPPFETRRPAEPRRERDREQEAQQDLGSGESDPQLRQELDQLAIGPLLLGLVRVLGLGLGDDAVVLPDTRPEKTGSCFSLQIAG
jgi:hypothetical protein